MVNDVNNIVLFELGSAYWTFFIHDILDTWAMEAVIATKHNYVTTEFRITDRAIW